MIARRQFLGLLISTGIGAGCGSRRAETPLAHLSGQQWLHGAYSYYAEGFQRAETRAQSRSFDAYRVLAQKGVSALSGLQSREVPFYIVAHDERFQIERNVPERLTLRAGMTAAERERASVAWRLARDHIQTDYVEITRLNAALDSLFAQLRTLRSTEESARVEQFKLSRQLNELKQGGEPPFELPHRVGRGDYRDVALLLLERLEQERRTLRDMEAAILAVALTARATDAGSMSLSANIQKVLLAVARDAANADRPSTDYPANEQQREKLLTRGREIHAAIQAAPDYERWLSAELDREDTLGQFLGVLDQLTGLPTSSVYKQFVHILRGEGDYLEYLKLATALVPKSLGLSGVLDGAVDTTQRYRAALSGLDRAKLVGAAASHKAGAALAGGALINVGSTQARGQLGRQLGYFESADEAARVAEELRATPLMR